MNDATAPLFDDSRRLTGPNLYFAGTGAALETMTGTDVDPGILEVWRTRLGQARTTLGWPDDRVVARPHRSGVSLAFEAPADQLYAATEVNEWAWLAALAAAGRLTVDGVAFAPGHAAPWDDGSALRTLMALARAEARPALAVLSDAAADHGLPLLADDDEVSIGAGTGSLTWPIEALPAPDQVPWPQLHSIPIALVTGSNGKTTTVRALAAILRGAGRHTAHSCTDGIYLDNVLLDGGDYSGPGGARALLRNRQADMAVLETARGGMLRRGLAVRHADVAVVTNVQPDHFGEYGIHDLDDLVQVKLTVARAIGHGGILVANADDERLRRCAEHLAVPRAWFAMAHGHPVLDAGRRRGDSTCGVRDGHLILDHARHEHDLGAVADMPLTLGGGARHNIANIAAAGLAAAVMGIEASDIAGVLAGFGHDLQDNPGRMQRWRLPGVDVFVDYAHNPDGLRQLLELAVRDRAGGRLLLLLGQAGNRADADIAELAAVAAAFHPDLVALKDLEGYERGRAEGEVAALLRAELVRRGLSDASLVTELEEASAARLLLASARDGDVVVLPTHATAARERVNRLLTMLGDTGWRAGEPLPVPESPDMGAAGHS